MNKGLMQALLTTIVVLFAVYSQPAGVNQERTNAALTVMPEAGFVYTADEPGNSISVTAGITRKELLSLISAELIPAEANLKLS